MASREGGREGSSDMSKVRRGIAENSWVDDVGMLKDRKSHFEVDRLITCNCLSCGNKAKKYFDSTFQNAFGKPLSEDTGRTIRTLYESFIQLERNAKQEIRPRKDPKTIFDE